MIKVTRWAHNFTGMPEKQQIIDLQPWQTVRMPQRGVLHANPRTNSLDQPFYVAGANQSWGESWTIAITMHVPGAVSIEAECVSPRAVRELAFRVWLITEHQPANRRGRTAGRMWRNLLQSMNRRGSGVRGMTITAETQQPDHIVDSMRYVWTM